MQLNRLNYSDFVMLQPQTILYFIGEIILKSVQSNLFLSEVVSKVSRLTSNPAVPWKKFVIRVQFQIKCI